MSRLRWTSLLVFFEGEIWGLVVAHSTLSALFSLTHPHTSCFLSESFLYPVPITILLTSDVPISKIPRVVALSRMYMPVNGYYFGTRWIIGSLSRVKSRCSSSYLSPQVLRRSFGLFLTVTESQPFVASGRPEVRRDVGALAASLRRVRSTRAVRQSNEPLATLQRSSEYSNRMDSVCYSQAQLHPERVSRQADTTSPPSSMNMKSSTEAFPPSQNDLMRWIMAELVKNII